MLLKHLYDFAASRNLLADPAFLRNQSVRWIIHLDDSGKLLGSGPQETIGPKPKKGCEYAVPKTTRPTGGGQVADFLVDDIGAIFALNTKPGATLKPRAVINLKSKHSDYWRQIEEAHAALRDSRLAALLEFRRSLKGEPPLFLQHDSKGTGWLITTSSGESVPLGNDLLSFAINASPPLFTDEAIKDYWRTVYIAEIEAAKRTAKRGTCLITGEPDAPLARTHAPMVTGLPPPAKGSGAGFAGADKEAFWSYGLQKRPQEGGREDGADQKDKNSGYIAPVSIEAARAYLVALKHLSRSENSWLRMGPAWLCLWAVQTDGATDIFARLLRKPDTLTVRKFFDSFWFGLEKPPPDSDSFIAVTLTAAATLPGTSPRLVVKKWVQLPLATAAKNLKTWFTDLHIETGSDTLVLEQQADEGSLPPLAVERLAGCTAPLTKKGSRLVPDEEKLSSGVITHLYRAALEGTAVPHYLLKSIFEQLRSLIHREKRFSIIRDDESRFALLRLIINRHHRYRKEPHMEIPAKQTPECQITDPAYNCGCLLSVFNSLQRAAHRSDGRKSELNTTLAERYFSSASSNPNAAFSILWRLHQHHLKKLRQSGTKGEKAAFRIKETITAICARFQQPAPGIVPDFPHFFTLIEQGRFALGYYQEEAKREAAINAWKVRKSTSGSVSPDSEPDDEELFSQN